MDSEHGRTPMDATGIEGISLVLEFSRYPPGRGSDVYLCGTCGVMLALRLAEGALGVSTISCQNCATCNHVESWSRSAADSLMEEGRGGLSERS